jgi:hypothetical protein
MGWGERMVVGKIEQVGEEVVDEGATLSFFGHFWLVLSLLRL